MNPESDFIVRKVWELVELCAEQRRHCRWVNMEDFRNALDSWEIGRKDAYAALLELEQGNYLLTMRRGEGDTITDIVITPEEEPPSKSSQRSGPVRPAEAHAALKCREYTTMEMGRLRIILGCVVAIYDEDRFVDLAGPLHHSRRDVCVQLHERAGKQHTHARRIHDDPTHLV